MQTLKKASKTLYKVTIFGLLLFSICLIQNTLATTGAAALDCGPQNAGLPDCQSGGANINGQTTTTTTTNTTSSSGACKDTTNAAGNVSNMAVQKCLDQSPIVHDLQTIVDFLSAAVGIVVIAVIILGGIQYTLAGDNATATSAAKTRITNGLIALAAFIFTFAFLQWLIPGGIFS